MLLHSFNDLVGCLAREDHVHMPSPNMNYILTPQRLWFLQGKVVRVMVQWYRLTEDERKRLEQYDHQLEILFAKGGNSQEFQIMLAQQEQFIALLCAKYGESYPEKKL